MIHSIYILIYIYCYFSRVQLSRALLEMRGYLNLLPKVTWTVPQKNIISDVDGDKDNQASEFTQFTPPRPSLLEWGTQQNLTPTQADRQPDWPDMGLSTSGDASKSTGLPELKVKIYGFYPTFDGSKPWFPLVSCRCFRSNNPFTTWAVKQVVATLPELLGRIHFLDLDIWDELGWSVWKVETTLYSMDWFKGKITGKPHISWENWWFPVL